MKEFAQMLLEICHDIEAKNKTKGISELEIINANKYQSETNPITR
jgi:hypothetical protein